MDVVPHGTLDFHVTETGVNVASHVAAGANRDVALRGTHVVLDEPVYRHITGYGRDVLLRTTDHDVADEPFIRPCGQGQEDNETENQNGNSH
jgi:hypothetical protein